MLPFPRIPSSVSDLDLCNVIHVPPQPPTPALRTTHRDLGENVDNGVPVLVLDARCEPLLERGQVAGRRRGGKS